MCQCSKLYHKYDTKCFKIQNSLLEAKPNHVHAVIKDIRPMQQGDHLLRQQGLNQSLAKWMHNVFPPTQALGLAHVAIRLFITIL